MENQMSNMHASGEQLEVHALQAYRHRARQDHAALAYVEWVCSERILIHIPQQAGVKKK